jgi:hypothetical protein
MVTEVEALPMIDMLYRKEFLGISRILLLFSSFGIESFHKSVEFLKMLLEFSFK